MRLNIVAAVVLLVGSTAAGVAIPRQGNGRQVFAHYMVGLTSGQSKDQWQKDITEAKSAGIDGFALNVGSADSWNAQQLQLAYDTASSNSFDLFLSFDMAASSWSVDQVVSLVNQYKGANSQLKVNGKPFVSTFEGPTWADNWAAVRSATGGIFLVPDWSSLGAQGVGSKLSQIDGAFNWGAWPNANEYTITTGNDQAYKSTLQGKPYMMGVSPYFYTDLPQYNKNWYSSSDSLWYDRWKQVLDIQPEYIEIITWNDYGESSYINDPVAAQIVSGAEGYVDGFGHSAFRFVLPYFISAYKTGNTNVELPSEGAVAWYRTTPAAVCGNGGTVWGQGGSASAASGTKDVISIIALSNSPKDITVAIGGTTQTVSASSSVGKASFYEIDFSGKSGTVTITFNGKSTTGPAISAECPSSGHVNFNSVAIQV
ncbi:glycoside hydrolase family 71 protein [Annulohypoxylon maeteangense]|uniref:glycoside hydrolase family 71 protein n=1 Tax=Annulohypoxylon maeteangense TaxID=1927788 RepID=UPI002008D967|nr:glycoside hydrolase family 71 protein [Annulohypoxylon maeteangense]KAI0880020.1 glycoside hydrolase family 71 protein [Annulohypoxylon maeteangense]